MPGYPASCRSNEVLTTILDSVNFGMMIVGKDRRIRRANRTALKMMGYDSEPDIVGRECHNVICPSEQGRCPVLDLGIQVDLSERVVLDRDGNRVPVLKSVSLVTLGGEEVLLETFVEVRGRLG